MKPLSQMTDGDLIRNFRKTWRWIGKNWQKGETIHRVKKRYFEGFTDGEVPEARCYLCDSETECCILVWADDETCEYAEYGTLVDAGSMSLKKRKSLAMAISKLPARRKRD